MTPRLETIETLVRREDAKRFIKEARGDDAEPASYLRIDEREAGSVRRSHRSLNR